MQNTATAGFTAPKGLRKAISIIMIVYGGLLLITALLLFTSGSAVDTSTAEGRAASLALSLLAIFYLIDAAIFLSFGIIGCVKVNDGLAHKKALTIFLLSFAAISFADKLISAINSVAAYAVVLYAILTLVFAAVVVFLILSLNASKSDGGKERLYGIIATSALLVGTVGGSIVNLVATPSSGSTNLGSTIVGLIIGSAIYVLYLLYFVKLTPEFVPTNGVTESDFDLASLYQNTGAAKDASGDKAEAIKKYKELLDSGAITQEEYDRKKADLLK